MREFFHPLVREWFAAPFAAPDRAAGPRLAGDSSRAATCSSRAPTGSGKTLSAFTLCLDDLVRRAIAGTLPEQTLVVYVSPLKALTNDVRENLEKPLGELTALAAERGVPMRADPHGRAYRRHDAGATAAHAAQAAARAGHDARVALHPVNRGEVARALRERRRRSSSTRFTPWPATSAARIWR